MQVKQGAKTPTHDLQRSADGIAAPDLGRVHAHLPAQHRAIMVASLPPQTLQEKRSSGLHENVRGESTKQSE